MGLTCVGCHVEVTKRHIFLKYWQWTNGVFCRSVLSHCIRTTWIAIFRECNHDLRASISKTMSGTMRIKKERKESVEMLTTRSERG